MIPRIDVRSAIARKQFSEELIFEYGADWSLLDIPFVSFSSPVCVTLRYEILENDDVEITGQMRFSLKGECSRCLSDAEQSFTAELDALFVMGESDGESYGYSEVKDEAELIAFLERVFKAIYASEEIKGFCYTQLADVEQEINGLLTKGRKPKADIERIARAVTGRFK